MHFPVKDNSEISSRKERWPRTGPADLGTARACETPSVNQAWLLSPSPRTGITADDGGSGESAVGTGVRHTAVSDASALSRLLLTTTPRGGGCCSRSQCVNRGAEPQVTKHLSQGTTLFRGGVDTCSQSRPAPEPACGQPPGSAGRRGRGSPAMVGREEGPALGASVGASGTRTQLEADRRDWKARPGAWTPQPGGGAPTQEGRG